MTQFLVPSKHQAAGHDGCLVYSGDESIFVKLTVQQEVDFYSETYRRMEAQEEDFLGNYLVDWMPAYMGLLQNEGSVGHDPRLYTMPVLAEDRARIEQLKKEEGVQQQQQEFQQERSKKYLVLENLYHGFSRPSIMDIKLGVVLFDESASSEKAARLQQVSKTTTSGSLGYRICGMSLFNGKLKQTPAEIFPGMNKSVQVQGDEEEYIVYDKFLGRNLTKDNVAKGVGLFFHFLSPWAREKVIDRFIKRLQLFYNCMLDTEIRIVSGSLLFTVETDPICWQRIEGNDDLYEELDPLVSQMSLGDDDDDDDNDDDDDDDNTYDHKNYNEKAKHSKEAGIARGDSKNKAPLSSLKFIDFAHAKYVDGQGYDENIIIGVENLLKEFQNIQIHQEKTFINSLERE